MSLDNAAPGGGEGDSTPITTITPAGPINNSRDAGREISAFRRKQAEQPAAPAAAPQEQPAVEPPQELADEASAAPQEIEATGETQEADPAVEPILSNSCWIVTGRTVLRFAMLKTRLPNNANLRKRR
jgi:hypothetical protein